MKPVVELAGVTHRYGRVTALRDVDLVVPEGSICALVGRNGAGKTTLLKVAFGLLQPAAGQVFVLGKDVEELTVADRERIGYVAEGLKLPGWMTLEQLEAYLAPLYSTWDHALTTELRNRFALPSNRPLKTFSRGERMKATLLCSLAARPRLLLMDEPFTGMDVVTKDEIVSGVLESAGAGGWSVLICSHDINELEPLADRVAILQGGRILLNDNTEDLFNRFQRVEAAVLPSSVPRKLPANWHGVERAGQRLSFIIEVNDPGVTPDHAVRGVVPDALRIDTRPASLREIFVTLVGQRSEREYQEAAI